MFIKDALSYCSSRNRSSWQVVLFGILAHDHRLGGIAATVDHTSSVESKAHDFDLLQPKVLVTHEEVLKEVLEALRRTSVKIEHSHILVFGDHEINGIRTVQEVLLDHQGLGVPVTYQPDELESTVAYLLFTSGSTGWSKAVMITHAAMVSGTHILVQDPAVLSSKDIALAYTAFHHGTALCWTMHSSIYFGIEIVILPRFTLEAFCETVQKFKVNLSFTQPWIISSLDREPIVKQYDMSTLKKLICAGAAVEKSVVTSFYENTKVATFNIYGMTEIFALFDITHEISLQNGVGKLAHGVTAKLVDEDGKGEYTFYDRQSTKEIWQRSE